MVEVEGELIATQIAGIKFEDLKTKAVDTVCAIYTHASKLAMHTSEEKWSCQMPLSNRNPTEKG